ncbi:MAG: helix-turn-helix transcriptional regulator [Polyangiaceae bacterium]
MKRHARELGRRIAAQRRAAGLTQEALAELAGVNVKTVQGAEQGRTEPELRTLSLLAKALNSSLDHLVPGASAISAEAIIRRVVSELHELPQPTLEHVAAVVHALARNK